VNVLPGMTAHVILHLTPRMLGDSGFNGTIIPAAATVVDSGGKPYVWVFDPESKKVKRTLVTLGEMSGANVQVIDGLKGGEQIAISGGAHLREGMKVRPLTK